MKKLIETRNKKKAELDAMLEMAKTENRAFTDSENAAFDALEAEVRCGTTVKKLRRISLKQ